MEKTEKFRMRMYAKKTPTHIYAARVNKNTNSLTSLAGTQCIELLMNLHIYTSEFIPVE